MAVIRGPIGTGMSIEIKQAEHRLPMDFLPPLNDDISSNYTITRYSIIYYYLKIYRTVAYWKIKMCPVLWFF